MAVEFVAEPKRQCLSLARERSLALQASAVCWYVKTLTTVTETLLCLLSHTVLFIKGSDGMFALFVTSSSYVKVKNAHRIK